MSNDIGNFIAGFVTGEGCFSSYVEPRNGNGYRNFCINFCIGQRLDNVSTLKIVQRALRCGNICTASPYRCSKPQAHYYVSKHNDHVNVIVPFFRKYKLYGKKKREFEIWASIVQLVAKVRKQELRPTGKLRGISRWTKIDVKRLVLLNRRLKKARLWSVR
jgi:hypothetical protein